MSEVEYANEVSSIDSIVLGAFENAMSKRGLPVSPEVKNYLIEQVRPNLDAAHSRGELAIRKDEITTNTQELVERLASFETTQISIDHVSNALDWLCNRYEYFFPFCPRR